jgi:hypothetical protein
MCKAAAVDKILYSAFYPLTPAVSHPNHSHLITTHLQTGMYIIYTSDNIIVFTMEKLLILQSTINLILTLYSLVAHGIIKKL